MITTHAAFHLSPVTCVLFQSTGFIAEIESDMRVALSLESLYAYPMLTRSFVHRSNHADRMQTRAVKSSSRNRETV